MSFRLKILSPHMIADADVPLFNRIYAEWKTTFREVIESKGGKLDPDDFFRNDNVAAILDHKDDIVALCTLTVFDIRLSSSLEHHYLQALDSNTPEKLSFMKIKRVMSMEYVNVLPAWRKSLKGTPWVEIFTGSMLKLMDKSNIDALIGTPRTDLKVQEACKILEAIELQEPIRKMDYPCAVVLFRKQENRVFKNQVTEHYVQELLRSLEEIDLNKQFKRSA